MRNLNGTKSANRMEIRCPECRKRFRAPDRDRLRAQMVRHLRNCAPVRRQTEALMAARSQP